MLWRSVGQVTTFCHELCIFHLHLVETILEEKSYRVKMTTKLPKNIHFVAYADGDLAKKKNRQVYSKKLSFESHFYSVWRIYQLLSS